MTRVCAAAFTLPERDLRAARASAMQTRRRVGALTINSRNGCAMDAPAYVELSDAIASAATAEQIQGIEARLEAMDLHPLDRLALQRVARVRRELIGRTTPPDGLPGLDTPGRPKTDD